MDNASDYIHPIEYQLHRENTDTDGSDANNDNIDGATTDAESSFSSSVDTLIIFECNDLRRDTGLILLKRKKDERFELHLHNDYTNQAIAMILDIKDFAKMFESLEEYFLKTQIESYE